MVVCLVCCICWMWYCFHVFCVKTRLSLVKLGLVSNTSLQTKQMSMEYNIYFVFYVIIEKQAVGG